MKVTFKTSSKSEVLELEASQTIQEVKAKLSERVEIPESQIKLVHKGRIAKDADQLGALNIADGSIVHVIKSGVAPAPSGAGTAAENAPSGVASNNSNASAPAAATPLGQNTASNSTNPSAPAQGFDGFAGLGSLGGLGGLPGMGGMPNLNPAMIQQMLQNPVMQSMMQQITENPDMMRTVLNSNPMLQQMSANNPILAQTLNNPQLMRDMFNPANLSNLLGSRPDATAPAPTVPSGTSGATTQPFGTAQAPFPDLSAFLGGGGGAQGNPFAQMMGDPEIQRQAREFASSLGGAGAGGTGAGFGGAAGGNADRNYDTELSTLSNMGFADRAANLNALRMSQGDIHAAVELLLQGGQGN